MVLAFFLQGLLALQVTNAQRARPAALLAFEDARAAIRATFRVNTYGPGAAPNRFRSIVTGDQVALFSDGRTDGVTGLLEDGTPLYGLESAALSLPDATWTRQQRSASGSAFLGRGGRAQSDVLDFRSVGMLPDTMCWRESPRSALESSADAGEPITYSEELTEEGKHIVERLAGGRKTVWYIDPALGWNASRVEQYLGDRLVTSATTEYIKMGGTWVPVKTVLSDADGEVTNVTEIEYSAVDSSTVPANLGPEDIGFLPGMYVNVQDGQAGRAMFWTGESLVPPRECRALLRQGAVVPDPRIEQLQRAQQDEQQRRIAHNGERATTVQLFGSPYPFIPETQPTVGQRRVVDESEAAAHLRERIRAAASQPVDAWDRYVEDFVRGYELDADQADKCQAILRDCKERRDACLAGLRPRLEALASQDFRTEGDRKLAEEKMNLLLKPVTQIFEQLKRRVLKVPTRRQLDQHGGEPAQDSKSQVGKPR